MLLRRPGPTFALTRRRSSARCRPRLHLDQRHALNPFAPLRNAVRRPALKRRLGLPSLLGARGPTIDPRHGGSISARGAA